jgi:YHS domain-containing protein
MNQSKILALLIAASLSIVAVRADDDAAAAPTVKPQTTCPVMGGKINRKLYADVDGKRIYVCCRGCIAAIKKDPAKYIKKLEDQGVTIAKLQTTCPVMGGKINKKLYADVDGKRIYVCCGGCIAAIKKDPAEYIKKLEDQGVVLEDAPTTPAE